MKCPNFEELNFYFYGESEKPNEIKNHLSSCQLCQKVIYKLTVEQKQLTKAVDQIQVPLMKPLELPDKKKTNFIRFAMIPLLQF